MAGQIEQAQPETADEVADVDSVQSNARNGQVLNEVVQQRVAQAIQPVLANVQDRIAALVQAHVRQELRNHPLLGAGQARGILSEDGKTIDFPVSLSAERAEDVLRTTLATTIDMVFSENARSTVEEQAKNSAQSLVSTTRASLPEDGDREKLQGRVERELDKMLDELFSRSMRDKARRRGERVARDLVRGDLPSVQEDAAGALQSLLEQWSAVTFEHWEKASRMVIKAVEDAAGEQREHGKEHAEHDKQHGEHEAQQATKPAPQAKSESASASHSAESESESAKPTRSAESESADDDVPQTILRSDKRAQQIWTKARDRAASEADEELTGERAAYEALKEEYEKQGDHWVRKDTEDTKAKSGVSPRAARASSTRRRSGGASSTRSKSPAGSKDHA